MKLANLSLGGECLGHGGSVASNVRFWHKAEIAEHATDVRFRGKAETSAELCEMSASDPKRT